jgi:hypothetical protein
MKQQFTLPQINAIVGSDKDVLQTIFRAVQSEITRLREEIDNLKRAGAK